ncbi:MAG TPA: PP2C family protein-serine/threonine phosphatase [Candidatus Limnocylindrales bacterium]
MQSRAEKWNSAILDLLREAARCQPDQLPALVNAVTEQLAKTMTIFLVDFEQHTLRELTTPVGGGEEYPVQGSLAGLAYQRGEVQAQPGDRHTLWIPLIDSTERLGVVRVVADDPFPPASRVSEQPDVEFVNLLGHLITGKSAYGDRLHLARSTQPMTVASVLLRQLLPPSTFVSDRVSISASLQPAYAVGGDAYDYAIDADTMNVAIFDAVGHGMPAGLSVAVALSATRAARRNGEDIAGMAEAADTHLNENLGEGDFVTAALIRLDLETGVLLYLSAGHPAPVVVQANGGIVTLAEGRRTPLALRPATVVPPGEHRLQPGDRVLLYTDGVIENRRSDGDFYTTDRLLDLARRLVMAKESTAEVARKINQMVVDFHQGPPEDDSTVVVLEWSTAAAGRVLA